MNVISVSKLNELVKMLIEDCQPLRNIYVSGEISNFTHYYRSGHMYFTLKDEKSQIKAVMFSSYAAKLRFKPENGMKVICRGRLAVYEKSGEYQIYAEDLQPDGLGALNLAFEQLKMKLFSEGVCSDEVKKSLPLYPKKIGVATSNIGAAVEDIKNITKRRYPLAELVIVPTIVQGAFASADIVKSIEFLDSMGDVDVIIVGRGGGSIEDLWAFNTEEVARAVIACKTPVVSAVGHETDYTICDFVADLRAPTPSAAAELVCPDILSLINYVDGLKKQLDYSVNSKINDESIRLDELSSSYALADYSEVIKTFEDNVSVLMDRMNDEYQYSLETKGNTFAVLVEKLSALSPLAVLTRGYSICEKNGRVVKNINEVKANDCLDVKMNGGNAVCKVLEVTENG